MLYKARLPTRWLIIAITGAYHTVPAYGAGVLHALHKQDKRHKNSSNSL
ncbi:hypothetical protein MYVALT_E_00570 [Candidatus Vallotia tarda]|uniref:Uncharacterized protein n=1 Tax=Candidatus Vallotiella hemipterorum TaxID=1177213 RepID=A0A916JU58_9BURK|nr:hypothetical protein MYVALT_E_00570 [Candidatus Vallotia tarda]